MRARPCRITSSPADQALTLIAFRQARRRTFNERLAEIEFAPQAMLYRCECGLVACGTAIKLTGLDYMAVRANPRRFIAFADHAILEAEMVVATRGAWSIIEKHPGPAADFAAATHTPSAAVERWLASV